MAHDGGGPTSRARSNAKDETAAKLKTATGKRDEARVWKEGWDRSWPDAMRALGGSATASPTEGNKLATEWATARGILSTIGEIKKRLARMEEDEDKLHKETFRTAHDSVLTLPRMGSQAPRCSRHDGTKTKGCGSSGRD